MERVKLVVQTARRHRHPRRAAAAQAGPHPRRAVRARQGGAAVRRRRRARLREALSTDAGLHAVLDVTFEGQKRRPTSHRQGPRSSTPSSHVVTHVDLQEIRLDEPIETTVTSSSRASHGRQGGRHARHR